MAVSQNYKQIRKLKPKTAAPKESVASAVKKEMKKEIVEIVKKAQQTFGVEGNIQVKRGTAPKIITLGDAQEHHEETPEVLPKRCRIYSESTPNST